MAFIFIFSLKELINKYLPALVMLYGCETPGVLECGFI